MASPGVRRGRAACELSPPARSTMPVVVATVALTILLLLVVPRPLSPDVAGQLWIADRMRHGARLYVDISEINPPLWFWLAMPVDALADALRWRADIVLILLVGGAAMLSLVALERLLAPTPGRLALLLYAAAILLVMPLRDVGQREQLTLMAALPYAALIAARREHRRVAGPIAWGVAGAAAIGFAFKHYFVVVPLALEVWLMVGQRRAWRPWRPELLVLTGVAVSYVAAIVFVTPAYLAISVPELTLAYRELPAWNAMLRPAQPVWLLAIAAIAMRRPATRLPPLTVALLIAAGAFAAAWAIQGKGWPYHSIAATGALAVALASVLARAPRRPALIGAVALVAPLLLPAFPTHWAPTSATDIAPALADLRSGDRVAVIAVEARTAWPAAMGRNLRFVGRRWSYWMLPAVDAHPGDPGLAAFGRQVVREAAVDLACAPPRRLIFAPGGTAIGAGASGNPLGHFARDPGFAAILRHYRRLDRPGGFDAFDLTRPLAPAAAARCPRL